jgi:hypothetical protein
LQDSDLSEAKFVELEMKVDVVMRGLEVLFSRELRILSLYSKIAFGEDGRSSLS